MEIIILFIVFIVMSILRSAGSQPRRRAGRPGRPPVPGLPGLPEFREWFDMDEPAPLRQPQQPVDAGGEPDSAAPIAPIAVFREEPGHPLPPPAEKAGGRREGRLLECLQQAGPESVIWHEILGPPRALRPHPRGTGRRY